MNLQEFESTLAGQTVVIAGNGPGLKNIPFAFLEAYPNFTINYFHHWTPWLRPIYWCALDPPCMENMTLDILQGIPKFVSPWGYEKAKSEGWLSDDGTVIPLVFDVKIPKMSWARGEQQGVRYGTSILFASHLAIYMGAKRILWVGFDCTHAKKPASKDDLRSGGRSHIPHYYDDQEGLWMKSWCIEAGSFVEWANEQGVSIINCSIPTACKSVPLGNYRDYWREPVQHWPPTNI
jgi:hypothetical protein